jgi:hypothetical protein
MDAVNQTDREDRTGPEAQGPAPGHKGVDFDPGRPIKSYLTIVYWVVVDPRAFFTAMSVDGGYKGPWLFTIISVLIPWIGAIIFFQSSMLLILYPMALLGVFIFSGMVHFSATKLMGGKSNFQATFRVVAYTGFTIVLGPIPYIGLAIHLFGLYLAAHGLAVVHKMSLIRGILAVVIIEGALRLLQYQMMGQVAVQ